MNIICPFCRAELETPPEYNGQKIQCPECGNKFITRKHSLNKFKLDSEKVKSFVSTTREYQILLASIILASAIIIYGILSYNTHRYSLHTGNSLKIFDKNTGEIYWRNGHLNFINPPDNTGEQNKENTSNLSAAGASFQCALFIQATFTTLRALFAADTGLTVAPNCNDTTLG